VSHTQHSDLLLELAHPSSEFRLGLVSRLGIFIFPTVFFVPMFDSSAL
jgi:hypothetical protein